MKHFILLLVLLVFVYFGWQYTPFRAKFFIKSFVLKHAFAFFAIWIILWIGVFFAANNGSINIL
jgi:hypothetical protein